MREIAVDELMLDYERKIESGDKPKPVKLKEFWVPWPNTERQPVAMEEVDCGIFGKARIIAFTTCDDYYIRDNGKVTALFVGGYVRLQFPLN